MKITPIIICQWLLFGLILYFSFQLVKTPTPWIFIDGLNLGIHEVGHLLFSPFGQFIYVLGGSLFQTLVPMIFFFYFLIRREFYSVAVMLFWVADNVINVSVYMRDAQVRQLPLLGDDGSGSAHDWHWLFTQTGLLPHNELIANIWYVVGIILLGISIAGMVYFTLIKMRLKDKKTTNEETLNLTNDLLQEPLSGK